MGIHSGVDGGSDFLTRRVEFLLKILTGRVEFLWEIVLTGGCIPCDLLYVNQLPHELAEFPGKSVGFLIQQPVESHLLT